MAPSDTPNTPSPCSRTCPSSEQGVAVGAAGNANWTSIAGGLGPTLSVQHAFEVIEAVRASVDAREANSASGEEFDALYELVTRSWCEGARAAATLIEAGMRKGARE